MTSIKNIYPTFSSIESPTFKKKVYDACVLFAIESNNILSSTYKTERFPSDIYNTLEDLIKIPKSNKKSELPPKKKRSPVKKITRTSETDDDQDDVESKTEAKTEAKTKPKKNPIVFNKNAKSVIDFIINRFLWEAYYIQPDDDEDNLESKNDIENYILKNIKTEFTKDFNISELIINSVKNFPAVKNITESYGLNKEFSTKFIDQFEKNALFATIISEYLVEFLKLLMMFFTNKFWLEKTNNVNFNSFQIILSYIEFSISTDCKTLSSGLMEELIQYNEIINAVKAKPKSDNKDKSDDKDKSKKSETSDKKKIAKQNADKKKIAKQNADKKKIAKKNADKKKKSDTESENENDDDDIDVAYGSD